MDITDNILFIIESAFSYFGQGEVVKEYRERRNNKKANAGFFTEIASFYDTKLDWQVKVTESAGVFSRSEAYQYWIGVQFSEIKPMEKNALVLFGLCDEYNKSKNVETFGAIKSYVDVFEISFSSISSEVKMLLDGYNRLFHSSEKVTFNTLLSGGNANYNALLKEFADKYSKELALQYVTDKLSQSEELRDTLVKLIQEGRLSAYGLNNKTMEQLESELRSKANYAKTFVIIANKVPKKIEDYLHKQPRLGSAPWASNIPGQKKPHKFSMYLIRPEEGFRNSAELLEKFKSLSKKQKDEMLVQILPVDGTGVVNYNFPANQSFQNDNLKSAYKLSSYFKGGTKYSDADIWNIMVKSEMSITDILALIPFNILVPGIFPSEKDFIIKNYPTIQKQMEVKTLTDWAGKTPKHLKKVLENCGEINYNIEEINAAAGEDRLKKISEEIISNSEKLKTSLGLLN